MAFSVGQAWLFTGYALTVKFAILVVPPNVAVMPIVVDLTTFDVEMVNVALLLPAAIVTLAGVLAAPLPVAASATVTPPVGATPLMVTVPVQLLLGPPIIVVGLTVRPVRTGARTVIAPDC